MTLPNRAAYSSMETTTKKTCKQLYEWHPAFRGMVDGWVLHRWCPVEMFDLLTEEDMDDAADCAKWCYEQPERSDGFNRAKSRTFPWKSPSEWYWYVDGEGAVWADSDCNMVPGKNLQVESGETVEGESSTEAILALLDAWRIA